MGKEKLDDKQHAKLLYLHTELAIAQLAEKVGVNRNTIGTWIKEGQWDKLKNFEFEQLDVAKEYLVKLSDLAKKTGKADDKGVADRAAKYASIVRSLSANNLTGEELLKALEKMQKWVGIHKTNPEAGIISDLMIDYARYISEK